MTQHLKTRRRRARVLNRRDRSTDDFFLNHDDFRFAAECERMRVHRNGSVVALLLLQLPPHKASPKDVRLLSRILAGRLRLTDTAGQLEDGRIGVLLPDTSAEGAWKVAEDISEVYPPGLDRPRCEVLVYPDHTRPHDQHQRNGSEVGLPAENEPESHGEFFFVQPMPLAKRVIDILGACLGLVVTAPFLLGAGLMIKLTSPGPVFFSQEREGLGGKRFMIWKLRTMCTDAEQRKESLQPYSAQDGPAFKMKKDPRITAFGRFLRWSSIDELPQFWNILRGQMSLVGPRPLPTEESLACKDWQRRRLDVTPGLTCTWQVSGRGKVRFDEWVRMDLSYVENNSLQEDLKLMVLTVPSLLLHKGVR